MGEYREFGSLANEERELLPNNLYGAFKRTIVMTMVMHIGIL